MGTDEGRGNRLTRRQFILTASGVALPLVTGCRPHRRHRRVRVGICDSLAVQSASACVGEYATRRYDGLLDMLRNGTKAEVKVDYYRLDEQMVTAIVAGQVDVAVCKTWTLMRGLEAGGPGFERVLDVPGPDDSPLLRSLFLTRADGPVTSLEDASGGTVALGNGEHYESYFLALQRLEAAGVRPARTETVGTCLEAAARVLEGDVQLAAVSHYCADHSGRQLAGRPDVFRQVGATAGVPWITVALSAELPRRTREELARRLRSLQQNRAPADLETATFRAPIPWSPEGFETA